MPGIISSRHGSDPQLMTATATAPGTFGELLQGERQDGTPFLVTLPITMTSRVSVRLTGQGPVEIYPAHKHKSLQVARKVLNQAGHHGGAFVVIDSPLPPGKGLASSSADLVATARAVARSVDIDPDPAQVSEWLRGVEPTDGVMYPEVVVYEHVAVQLQAVLGPVPDLTIVAVDEGGELDTVTFHRTLPARTQAEREEYADLLMELTAAFHDGDLAGIGSVATRSALMNARINPRLNLAPMVRIAREVAAVGVICAHSGTMLGVAVDRRDGECVPKIAELRRRCAALPGTLYEFSTLATRGGRGA